MRYVNYLRYSSDMQRDTSIEDQRALDDTAAEKRGWDKVNEYADRALKGTTMHRRTELMRMLEDGEMGKFDVVVCEHTDRLSREPADLYYIYNCFRHDGVKIFSIADNEFINPMHLAFRGFQNSQFVTDLGHKCRRGQSGAFGRGVVLGSPAYGYSQSHGLRTIKTEEAEVVQRIHSEYAAGVHTAEIVRRLNADGIETRNRKLWSDTQLFGSPKYGSGILRNPIYVGQLRWGIRIGSLNPRTGNRESKQAPPENVQVRYVPELRIIDDDTWERVQRRLASAALNRLDRRRLGRHLLSGKTVCGLCEQGYVRRTTRPILVCSGHYHKRACANVVSVTYRPLEAAILEMIRNQLLDDAFVDAAVKEYCAEHNRLRAETTNGVDALSRRETAREKELTHLMQALKEGPAESNATHFIRREMERVLEQLNDIRKQVKLAKSPMPSLELHDVRQRIHQQLSELSQGLEGDGAAAAAARNTLRALIDKIVITPLGDPSSQSEECQLSVEVQGQLGKLLALAGDGQNEFLLTASSSWRRQYTPVGKWVVTISVIEPRPARLARLKSDCSRILRLLFLDKPLTVQHLSIQIACSDRTASKERATKQRVQRALTELATRGRVISTPLIGNRALGWQLAGEANSEQVPPRSAMTDPGRSRTETQRVRFVKVLSEVREPLTTRQIAQRLLGHTMEGMARREFVKAVASTGHWLRRFRTEGLVRSAAANKRDLLWTLANSHPK